MAKTRLYLSGRMPFSYRLAFGSRIGVDGYFVRHFHLTMPKFVAALRSSGSDAEFVQWFLARPGVNTSSIADWNSTALRLGRPGNPGYLTLRIVRWVLYPKSILRPVDSIFESIAQDEKLERPKPGFDVTSPSIF
jgi:hypothetical protein